MKITVEISDELHRAARIEAARRGTNLDRLVVEGLRTVLKRPRRTRSLAVLMKPARAVFDSGRSDLGSNSGFLANFGRDRR